VTRRRAPANEYAKPFRAGFRSTSLQHPLSAQSQKLLQRAKQRKFGRLCVLVFIINDDEERALMAPRPLSRLSLTDPSLWTTPRTAAEVLRELAVLELAPASSSTIRERIYVICDACERQWHFRPRLHDKTGQQRFRRRSCVSSAATTSS